MGRCIWCATSGPRRSWDSPVKETERINVEGENRMVVLKASQMVELLCFSNLRH